MGDDSNDRLADTTPDLLSLESLMSIMQLSRLNSTLSTLSRLSSISRSRSLHESRMPARSRAFSRASLLTPHVSCTASRDLPSVATVTATHNVINRVAMVAFPRFSMVRRKIILACILLVVSICLVISALAGQEWFTMQASTNFNWIGAGVHASTTLHFSVHGALWDDTSMVYTSTGQADVRKGYINVWNGNVGADLKGTGEMSFNRTDTKYTCKKLRPQSDAEAWLKAALCENAIAIFVWLMVSLVCMIVSTGMLVCWNGSQFAFGVGMGFICIAFVSNIAAVSVYAAEVVNAYETDFNSDLMGFFFAAQALFGIKTKHGVGSSFVAACVAPAFTWHVMLIMCWARKDFMREATRTGTEGLIDESIDDRQSVSPFNSAL